MVLMFCFGGFQVLWESLVLSSDGVACCVAGGSYA